MSGAIDAVVIGAGPAGATAALVMARAGMRVALVEKAGFPRRKVCGEFVSATTWALLHALGVAPGLLASAGPPVRRVALYARDAVVDAPMPTPPGAEPWGRAIGREHLDAALADAARAAGATTWQPWSATALREDAGECGVDLEGEGGALAALRARVVVAAHGSWERGSLPTQPRRPHRAGDLLGFKAHFLDSRLPAGWMPLVLFPGGYGGLVHAGDGRTGFSCCIRRDVLAQCRRTYPHASAGEALLRHVTTHCRGLAEALEGASPESAWLAAGPIEPGLRAPAHGRVFRAGNAAGEAHPLVAEGISMAIQSGWLLGQALADAGDLSDARVARARASYAAAWRGNFAARVRASSLFAALTGSPATAAASVAAMRAVPSILTWGARWSGKARIARAAEVPA